MSQSNIQPRQTNYAQHVRKKWIFLILLCAFVMVAAFVSIAVGSAGLSVGEIFLSLIGQGSDKANTIVLSLRLPRVVTALLGGIGLAGAGCVMQSLLRNPLASSSTLGVSQGAAFGASFAIIVLGAGVQGQSMDSVTLTNPYLVTICAFVGSMLSTFVVLGLARFKNVSPETVVLSGVALSALFSGATTLIQYFADDVKVAAVVFWTFGDLGRTSWREVLVLACVTLPSLFYFLLNRWNYNALMSGEQSAKGLGVSVTSTRLVGMVICSLTCSVIVSFVGIINFIGLIAPHVVKKFVGADHRFLLPASALVGALLLLVSDIAARLIVSPIVLPIGAITSFLGAPLFMFLLFKGVAKQ